MIQLLHSRLVLCIALLSFLSLNVEAQDYYWPRDIVLENGAIITIYEPQPEKLEGNKLKGRAAIAVREHPDSSQIFGAIFATALLETNRDERTALLEKLTVNNVRFPGFENEEKIAKLTKIIEEEVPLWNLVIPLDLLVAGLEEKPNANATGFNNDPPTIIYANKPSLLISIMGEPVVKMEKGSSIERVVNTPFPIIKDGPFYYIFAGGYWYRSRSVTSGWESVAAASLSATLKEIDADIRRQQKEQERETGEPIEKTDGPVNIIVATTPTELIQTTGLPVYNSVEGTSLLYVSNTTSDIFKDIESQKVYLLLAGRWFASPTIEGPWEYVPSDKLPADFAEIPFESDKGDVLANVAGTEQAQEAVLDAMIPQTAKVYRKDAKLEVVYDGAPIFEPIKGTSMQLAVNTTTTVFQANGRFFALDNGIWFVSDKATGPWVLSDERPEEVNKVPPDCRAYNAQHVHIYESNENYVVTGYTQGYTQTFVQGPTIVYGTGWMMSPWVGPVLFVPPPMIWGFGFRWHPWWGWSMGFGFRVNMFWGMGGVRVGVGFGMGVGFFGPPMFRPPIVVVGVGRRPPMGGWGRPPAGGWGRPGIGGGNNNNINIGGGGGNTINIGNGNGNNIYNNRPGVVNNNRGDRPGNRPGANAGGNNTRPGAGAGNATRPGTGEGRPETRPGTGAARPGNNSGNLPGGQTRPTTRETRPSREPNNVITDRNGDVFRRDQNGNWNQRNGNNWQQNNRNNNRQLDQMQQGRDRSMNRQNTYQPPRTSPSARPPANSRPPSGSGTRPPSGGTRPSSGSRPPSSGSRPASSGRRG